MLWLWDCLCLEPICWHEEQKCVCDYSIFNILLPDSALLSENFACNQMLMVQKSGADGAETCACMKGTPVAF